MVDMLLLTEVAELANALDDFEFDKNESPLAAEVPRSKKKTMDDAIRESTMHDLVRSQSALDEGLDSDEEMQDKTNDEPNRQPWNRLRTSSDFSVDEVNQESKYDDLYSNQMKPERDKVKSLEDDSKSIDQENSAFDKDASADESVPPPVVPQNFFSEELPALDDAEPPIPSVHEPVHSVLRQESTTAQIKSLLDRWEEVCCNL